MKIEYDKEVDAMYLKVKNGSVQKTVKMNKNVLVDVNREGEILGIEMLDASSSSLFSLHKFAKSKQLV
ncbi:MAG: DUF2283 domain-containing protein [Candidatus Taylorbacteria bacterium]|nr:DUF2283 domain-containing protein [Candidatus Taylorbacteria bacterium]